LGQDAISILTKSLDATHAPNNDNDTIMTAIILKFKCESTV